jgi:hydroxymethylpyrimidine pyrophosphatase-like HAD family hydrolase
LKQSAARRSLEFASQLALEFQRDMRVFSTKLDDIRKTLMLGLLSDANSLSVALSSGTSRLGIAVGSGGSAISAAYLRVCRNTLGFMPTLVQTPMEFVLGLEKLSQAQLYLFSSGGNNPDILAAHDAAVARSADAIHVVTNNAASELARRCSASQRSFLHVLPVTDPKDGFLATHSLMSTVGALLTASDRVSSHAIGGAFADRYLFDADEILAMQSRQSLAQTFTSLRRSDTILLLHDPRLMPVGLLIETSVWEAGLCGVQRTDHRNFAHGRHVWLEKRPAETMLISLTGAETRAIWKDIDRSVPSDIRRFSIDLGNCGRFQNAIGILRALTIVEALGRATEIDPGKPGAGPFAKNIYESPSLEKLAEELPAAVRHKRASMLSCDDPDSGSVDLLQSLAALKARFTSGTFAGVVLDYDGTIVSAEGRYDPPGAEIVAELSRLLDEGVRLAIATGRGGSAGEQLRDVIPQAHHAKILVGYYNGAHIRSLDIDIRSDPPPAHAAITQVIAWLDRNPNLFKKHKFRKGAVQAAIEISDLKDVVEFQRRFSSKFGDAADVRMSRSAHTVDICLMKTCKTAVVNALAYSVDAPAESILCIGDRGAPFGNDYVMLGMPYGVSVDQVCDRPDVCWSFFGMSKTGPQALLHILRSLHRGPHGLTKLDVDALSNTET